MKKIAIVVVLLIAAWAAGFWPERTRRKDVEVRREQLERELAECHQRVRVAAVLGRLLDLRDAVAAKNYGIAQGLSSRFFDAVREEARLAAGTPFQPLEAILEMRDPLTAALTQADPAVEEMVRGMEGRLRDALGYTSPGVVPSPPPASPPTGAAPSPTPSSAPPG